MSRIQRSVPSSWGWVPLSELGIWYGGGTPSKANPSFWKKGTIPWVSPKDMKVLHIRDAEDHITSMALKFSTTNLIPSGSVLVVTRSGILRHSLPVAVTEIEVAINQDLKALVPHAGINPFYVAYALKAFESDILAKSSKAGTTVQSIELPRFLNIEIPLAPTAEQGRITEEIEVQLSRLDAAVESLDRCRVNFVRYRASVLKAACEGQLNKKVELSEANLRRPPLADISYEERQNGSPSTSGLPNLPESWVWANLEKLASSEANSITDGPFGSNLKTIHYTESGPRVVRLQNIGDGEFINGEAHISFEHYRRLIKHKVEPGDLVIALLGERLPRACVIPNWLGPAIVKADCVRFKPNRNVALSSYLNVALNAKPTRDRTSTLVHGVGRLRLNLKEIRSILVPLPPVAEQVRISEEVERRLSILSALRTAVESNLGRIASLRQSILQEAFKGRLVPQASGDEATHLLLDRIRKQRRATGSDSKRQRKPHSGRARVGNVKQMRPLLEILRESDAPLSPEELFHAAGFDKESSDSIDLFYEILKAQIDIGAIKEERKGPTVTLRVSRQ